MKYRTVLITGATGGIGEALVSLLSDQNVSQILVGRDNKRLLELKAQYPSITYIVADLAKERRAVIDAIWKERPDLIINNAGFGIYGEAYSLSTEEQLEILEVNGKALLEITLEGIKAMIERKKEGIILNVSSITAQMPMPLMSVYGASKSFVSMFSRACDFECKKKGVRVLVSLPGQVGTPFARKAAKSRVVSSDRAVSAEAMARRILRQIERRRGVDVYDWRYRVLGVLTKYFLPEALVSTVIEKSIRKRLR